MLDDFAGVWRAHAGAGHPGLRFLRAVASHFKGLLAGVLALRVVNDMLSFVGPLALEQIIGWLTDPRQRRHSTFCPASTVRCDTRHHATGATPAGSSPRELQRP